jgi:hypothetical protein
MSDEGVAENGNTRGNMGQQDEGSTVTWDKGGAKGGKGWQKKTRGKHEEQDTQSG